MNILKFVFALLALMISGHIMAFATRVYNDSDYLINYNHRKDVTGWGKWHQIAPHSKEDIGGNLNVIREFHIQANYEKDKTVFHDVAVYQSDGTIRNDGIFKSAHGGCVIVHISRDENGKWKVQADGGKTCN